MKGNVRKIQKHRKFSDAFKRQIVKEFESGKYSVIELCKLYGLYGRSVYQWIYKFSTFNDSGYRVVEMKASSTKKVKQLEDRIRELERMVGQKQIKIDYLEKLMDVAKEELGIDVKKNSDTPPSGGSESTKHS